jgi:hypothetical protein
MVPGMILRTTRRAEAGLLCGKDRKPFAKEDWSYSDGWGNKHLDFLHAWVKICSIFFLIMFGSICRLDGRKFRHIACHVVG